ncbi:MAG: amidohydrolase [Leptospiraceae bacterium]|nr:amidohydrolase [Leptospiraceae bacterium]MCP5497075.1 amidohydrolase [Leptospiraceae bacterium]
MKQLVSEERKKELVEIRRYIHQYPEIEFQEIKTAQLVMEHLERLGYPYENKIAKTGVVSLIDSGKPGKTVLVRADMDALPIHEENDCEYRSKHNGIMHACGHDGHTSILMAYASELKTNFASMIPKGRVLLVFQPAEEGGGGAQIMVQKGILEKYKVDVAFALHVWNHIDIGKVGIVNGPIWASVDQFKITVHGKSGHGALPQHSVDPILVSAHIITALQSIVSRSIDPLEPCVITVGSINSGNAFNAIPDNAVMRGTVRTYSKEVHNSFPKRMEKIVEGISESFGAKAEVDYLKIDKPTINNPNCADFVRQAVRNLIGEDAITEKDVRSMGGEDFSAFLEKVPGCYFLIGSRNPFKNCVYPHHHSKFDFDEDALPIGLEVMKETVRLYLEQN